MERASRKPHRSRAMTTAAHYRLTSDEFLHINSQLTNAQLRVYLHYKTLDPFGDRRIEICTKAIAETLGITQRSVQLALNKLSSMGLLVWEKAKSFVRRNVDRLGEMSFAMTKSNSPRRNVDRERQLELSLEADSVTPQSSSILFNLDQDQDDEILDEEEEENFDHIVDSIEEEISVEEAIAEIRSAIPNEDLGDDDEDKAETPEQSKATGEGGFTRAAVEDFVLKSLNKSPKNRAAYFAKFSTASWKLWEKKYREAHAPRPAYKPYVPEKVEVASPDSPVAQSAIAMIKAKLGIK